MLKGKKVILGVCGSIAAYKSAELLRLLVKAGADVHVVMTQSAKDFVAPLTFSVLSNHPVHSEFTSDSNSTWNNHVEMATGASLFIIAPATAHTVSKIAGGHCDNLLLGVLLSSTCPVYIAPAMDLEMYRSATTQKNLAWLEKNGINVIYPTHGELASGLEGEGRMEEPAEILRQIEKSISSSLPLFKKKILVTAGPTRESIDPVRFISNHSSGKMGFALARELAELGAQVELVTGPVSLDISHPNIFLTRVNTSAEMQSVCQKKFTRMDGVIMTAAVADFIPDGVKDQKIKKSPEGISLHFSTGPDILADLGKSKMTSQVIIGFALESDEGINSAKEKLKRKNLDFIVFNSMKDAGAGFGTDTNKISILDSHNKIATFGLKSKQEVALDIIKTCLIPWPKS